MHRPVSASHNRTVLSLDPVASRPSADHATESTERLCPSRILRQRRLSASQRPTLSWDPLASRPSKDQATETTEFGPLTLPTIASPSGRLYFPTLRTSVAPFAARPPNPAAITIALAV